MNPIESGDLSTACLEFIAQRRKAGGSFEDSVYDLILSGICPFSQRNAGRLACRIMALHQKGKGRRALSKMLSAYEAEQRHEWFHDLKKQGIVGLKAEEIVAAREGTSV